MVEFHPKARMWEISALLHSLVTWDKYKVIVTCLMSSKPQLTVMARDRERARRAEADFVRRRQQLEKEAEALQRRSWQIETEEQETKLKIQDLLDKFEEQVKRIESCDSVPKPIDVSTPQDSDLQVTPTSPRHIFYKTPPLPKFSGTLPVPKGEGSYEQFVFQICGFRENYSEDAIKSSMIGAVTDGARDYLDFIGFRKDLSELIGALERCYGKGQTTDRIQQEFYKLSQERGETVQEFAGRIETKYKRLIELYPGRYDSEMLKERLFYGMTQHLRDSMRYLYKKPETNYEELLLTAKEAE